MGGGSAAIDVRNLSFSFGARAALAEVDLEVRQGELFSLLGPNGGGKTTLFRILSTLLPAPAGSATVLGIDVALRPAEVRRRIGVVFQSPSLDGKLTVRENLTHQGHLFGMRGRALREEIERLAERVGIADRMRERVERLSGGLKRRVEIAKGVLPRPELLLMDEPSAGLDPGARRAMWELVREIRSERGVTVLFTTHLTEEADGCDRLAILDRGRRVALGAPDELKSEVGGDVISIEAREASDLSARIREKFGVEARAVNGTIRIEQERAHALVPRLAEAFPGAIDAVTVRKPTLEDVFVRRTGRQFWPGEGG
jgi:ABC-2 type transport system ATP-binding protein